MSRYFIQSESVWVYVCLDGSFVCWFVSLLACLSVAHFHNFIAPPFGLMKVWLVISNCKRISDVECSLAGDPLWLVVLRQWCRVEHGISLFVVDGLNAMAMLSELFCNKRAVYNSLKSGVVGGHRIPHMFPTWVHGYGGMSSLTCKMCPVVTALKGATCLILACP